MSRQQAPCTLYRIYSISIRPNCCTDTVTHRILLLFVVGYSLYEHDEKIQSLVGDAALRIISKVATRELLGH